MSQSMGTETIRESRCDRIGAHRRLVFASSVVLFGVAMLGAKALSDDGLGPLPADPSVQIPLVKGWIENQGQWDERIRFAHRAGGLLLQAEDGALNVLRDGEQSDDGELLRAPSRERWILSLDGGLSEAQGVTLRPELYHFFVGSEEHWRTGVPAYQVVAYESATRDMRLELEPAKHGFVLRVTCDAEADPAAFSLTLTEADFVNGTRLGSRDLSKLPEGLNAQLLSCTEQEWDGEERSVAGALRFEEGRLGLALSHRTAGSAVQFTLGLEWSTLLGGSKGALIEQMALALPHVIVGGITSSFDFPVTEGAFDTTWGGGGGSSATDIFVARLDPTQDEPLLWATFLGGPNNENLEGLVLRQDGVIVLAGQTASATFPTTPGAFQPEKPSLFVGFVTGLSPQGDALSFSTFLGGTTSATALTPRDMALARDGTIVVVGSTRATDHPITPNAFQSEGGGETTDAFITCLTSDASALVYSTYYGGTTATVAGTTAHSVALLPNGGILVGGGSGGDHDLPMTPGAYLPTATATDGYVSLFDPVSGDLVAATFLGLPFVSGAGNGPTFVSVDSHGQIVVGTHRAPPSSFPSGTPGLKSTVSGHNDLTVMKLDSTLSTLLYGTFIGGTSDDQLQAMAVEPSGAVVLAGRIGTFVSSGGFPVTPGAFQSAGAGGANELFVLRLAPDGDQLLYSTLLGGSGSEAVSGRALAIEPSGAVWVGGWTASTNFPVTDGSTLTGGVEGDAFVSRLSMLPGNVARYGTWTAAPGRAIALGVASNASVGDGDFALTCSGAPPHASHGMLLLSSLPLNAPLLASGVGLWLDPTTLFLSGGIQSDAAGYAHIPLPAPNDPTLTGLRLFAQTLWPGAGPDGTLGASNALAIRVVPGSP